MKSIHIKCIYSLMTIVLSFGISLPTMAQMRSMPAQYYFNQYLGNAALAGADSSLSMTMSYNKQNNGLPGAPVNAFASVDGFFGKRVGLGLNVLNQKAGLFNQTRVALSYAYHLPVAEDKRLSFGLSAAVGTGSLYLDESNGDRDDGSLTDYNARSAYFDIDFGLAYAAQGLTLQAAVPSFRNHIIKDSHQTAERPSFYSSASYKFNLGEQINSIEPKLCFTEFKDDPSVWDLGFDLRFAKMVNLQALYHTTSNYSLGLGVDVLSRVKVLAMYTSEAGDLQQYSDGGLSVNMRVKLYRSN
ncbi:PorP/SprF family type IX secretion system membrane protein [Solitalea lacus]|uniref:PorP/SprF family type IX secretion system membrane protein n=1 Tax=Solitalea lacus TaxID=2911172 RepID=UPI001EDB18AD|nr:PorP/SprF family type IX secretion system membrane protein [Solitalea lacus]UKJ08572.1 PorP/SprF family type IX secretion system membrane protein [Solitalea lacus]